MRVVNLWVVFVFVVVLWRNLVFGFFDLWEVLALELWRILVFGSFNLLGVLDLVSLDREGMVLALFRAVFVLLNLHGIILYLRAQSFFVNVDFAVQVSYPVPVNLHVASPNS